MAQWIVTSRGKNVVAIRQNGAGFETYANVPISLYKPLLERIFSATQAGTGDRLVINDQEFFIMEPAVE